MAETRYSILETQGQMCVSVSGYIIVFHLSVAAFTREGFSDTSCDNDVLKNCRACYLIHFKVAEDTLNSLLCIYLKQLHEVQRLTPTGLQDIHNWIKDERII